MQYSKVSCQAVTLHLCIVWIHAVRVGVKILLHWNSWCCQLHFDTKILFLPKMELRYCGAEPLNLTNLRFLMINFDFLDIFLFFLVAKTLFSAIFRFALNFPDFSVFWVSWKICHSTLKQVFYMWRRITSHKGKELFHSGSRGESVKFDEPSMVEVKQVICYGTRCGG